MELEIRIANINDTEYLFKQANDHETRQNSFHAEQIQWDEHVKWFHNKLNDINSQIFIIFQNGSNIGSVKFEKKDEVVIGVTIDSEYRGKGLGAKIIKMGCLKYWEYNLSEITAYIKNANSPSLSAFERAGFKHIGETEINGFKCQKLILKYHVNEA